LTVYAVVDGKIRLLITLFVQSLKSVVIISIFDNILCRIVTNLV
jgi:hypothetical protein